jgi:hypothetical protein
MKLASKHLAVKHEKDGDDDTIGLVVDKKDQSGQMIVKLDTNSKLKPIIQLGMVHYRQVDIEMTRQGIINQLVKIGSQ